MSLTTFDHPMMMETGFPDFPDGASELECLRLVFRDRRQPEHRRWKALELAAKLATPRLTAVHVSQANDGFAERLQAAIERSAMTTEELAERVRGRLIEGTCRDVT